MKLVILDAQALNPGDLSWDFFSSYAEVTVYQNTPENLAAERIGDADAILINKININSALLEKCRNLKYIGVLATGYNVVQVEAVKKAGIVVSNIPAYSTSAVAQHTFALLLSFTNQVALHNDSVLKGDWKKSPVFCYWKKPLTELEGKTFGILGYGNIGRKVEKIAESFGMNVLVCPHKPNGNKNCVSTEELFEKSDIISLHAPLTSETAGIINKNSIEKMKDGVFIINTARGGLVCEEDVKSALENGKIAGYGADVLAEEPMAENCALFGAKNCVLTPHIAWAPLETRKRCLKIGEENFAAWVNGKPQNTIY